MISGREDRASAVEMVDALVRFQSGQTKVMKKLVYTAFLQNVRQQKGQCEDRWAGGSLTRKPKDTIAVSRPRQLGEYKCNYKLQ